MSTPVAAPSSRAVTFGTSATSGSTPQNQPTRFPSQSRISHVSAASGLIPTSGNWIDAQPRSVNLPSQQSFHSRASTEPTLGTHLHNKLIRPLTPHDESAAEFAEPVAATKRLGLGLKSSVHLPAHTNHGMSHVGMSQLDRFKVQQRNLLQQTSPERPQPRTLINSSVEQASAAASLHVASSSSNQHATEVRPSTRKPGPSGEIQQQQDAYNAIIAAQKKLKPSWFTDF